TMVFHPHGWIRSEQIIDLIDHAVSKHGKKVKFLTFREAEERLNKYLLGGQPLRHPKTGGDNGVRLLDVNHDGYLDVVISNEEVHQTRVWSPKTRSWQAGDFPRFLSGMGVRSGAVRFGIVRSDGSASFLFHNEQEAG